MNSARGITITAVLLQCAAFSKQASILSLSGTTDPSPAPNISAIFETVRNMSANSAKILRENILTCSNIISSRMRTICLDIIRKSVENLNYMRIVIYEEHLYGQTQERKGVNISEDWRFCNKLECPSYEIWKKSSDPSLRSFSPWSYCASFDANRQVNRWTIQWA